MTYLRRLWSAVFMALQSALDADKPRSLLVVLFTVLLGILPVLTAWVVKHVIDTVIAQPDMQGAVPGALVTALAAYALLTLISRLVPLLDRFANAVLGRKVDFVVQSALLQKVSGLPGIKHLEEPRFYNDIRLAESGAQQLPRKTFAGITTIARGSMTVIGFLGALITFSPAIATIVLLSALPQMLLEIGFSRKRLSTIEAIAPLQRKAQMYSFLLGTHYAAKEIRIFSTQNHILGLYRDLQGRVHKTMQAQERRDLILVGALDVLSVGFSVSAFALAALQALSGAISIGDVTLIVAAVGSVNGGLTSVVRAVAQFDEVIYYAERLRNVMNLESTGLVQLAEDDVPPLTSEIRVEDVSFRYSDSGPWVLEDLDIVLPAGKTLAVIGPNGSGKSTLVKLLTRLYDPTRGSITWDGRDLRSLDINALRGRCSVIFQDYVKYDMTVFDNIALGKLDAPDLSSRVRRAAQVAKIHDEVAALPKGYETLLSRTISDAADGEGADLSGGQWQRIAIARAFMRDADLVILDEPSAALDPQAEMEILESYLQLRRGRTTMVVSHRLRTTQLADFIAVMDKGRVVEYGTHEELIARRGYYYGLVQRYTSGFLFAEAPKS